MFLRFALKSLLLASSMCAQHSLSAKDISLEFIGEVNIESGHQFDGTIVGGLSGIDYDRASNSFVAISDDRDHPRFYTFTMDLSDGKLSSGDIEFETVHTILDVDGKPFTLQPDPESIRIHPKNGELYWASERLGNDKTPFIRVMDKQGRFLANINAPKKFAGISGSVGTRDNVGFESLTFTTKKNILIAANESALVQDGEKSTLTKSSTARVWILDSKKSKTKGEFIYPLDPIVDEPIPANAFSGSGLVELIALNKRGLIALERSYSAGAKASYSVKLYFTSTRFATNVKRLESIKGKRIRPMRKRLLLDLSELGIKLDNIEGISFGPQIDGQQTLILMSDDNFSDFGPQSTQFLAFKIDLSQ